MALSIELPLEDVTNLS